VHCFLLISSVATLSWKSLRPRRSVRLELIALFGIVMAALISEPWFTLVGICLLYLALIPYGMLAYARVRRQRAGRGGQPPAA
jgi:CDP-diacylglycerol--serine O-phosphatidyltransferase